MSMLSRFSAFVTAVLAVEDWNHSMIGIRHAVHLLGHAQAVILQLVACSAQALDKASDKLRSLGSGFAGYVSAVSNR